MIAIYQQITASILLKIAIMITFVLTRLQLTETIVDLSPLILGKSQALTWYVYSSANWIRV